ncbi:hypothetical protein D3C73_1249940 [compost metagenome]
MLKQTLEQRPLIIRSLLRMTADHLVNVLDHFIGHLLQHIGKIPVMQIKGHPVNARPGSNAVHRYFIDIHFLQQFNQRILQQLTRAEHAGV